MTEPELIECRRCGKLTELIECRRCGKLTDGIHTCTPKNIYEKEKMTEPELKPCSHCGGEAFYEPIFLFPESKIIRWEIACKECPSVMLGLHLTTKEIAAEYWNERI